MTSKTSRSLMARVSNELYNKVLLLASKAGETISEFVANELQKNVHAPVADKNLLAQQREFELCRRDPAWFIENYCKIKLPVNNVITAFQPYQYQKDLIKSFENKISVILRSRQIGMSTLLVAYALWTALFNKKTILIVTCNLNTTRNFSNILKVMFENLPNWMTSSSDKVTNHGASFNNGSIIDIVSYTIYAARGRVADLLILDEMAWMKDAFDAYAQCVTKGKIIISSTYNDDVSKRFDEENPLDLRMRRKIGEKKMGDDFRTLLSTHSNVIVLPYTVCPKMTNDVIENIKKTMSTKLFLQQFLCDYSSDAQKRLDAFNKMRDDMIYEGTKPLYDDTFEYVPEIITVKTDCELPTYVNFVLPSDDGKTTEYAHNRYVKIDALSEKLQHVVRTYINSQRDTINLCNPNSRLIFAVKENFEHIISLYLDKGREKKYVMTVIIDGGKSEHYYDIERWSDCEQIIETIVSREKFTITSCENSWIEQKDDVTS